MSCEDCEEAQSRGDTYYYRIENANVMVIGCKKHIKIMFDRLNSKDKK